MLWLKKFAINPKTIGSIAPSSKHLGRLMIKNLHPDAKVLELGSGSGSITEFIISKLNNPGNLTCVEIDNELAAMCGNLFPEVCILNQDIGEILSKNNKYDAIISGIPFAAMNKNERLYLFDKIRNNLSPSGIFVMFQYSLISRKELKNVFGNVKTDFTLLNLPPAFVYTCYNNQTDSR